MERQAFLEKFASQEVYLINSFDEVVFKSSPNGTTEQKRAGGKANPVIEGSKLFTEALLEGKEITKEEYLKY